MFSVNSGKTAIDNLVELPPYKHNPKVPLLLYEDPDLALT